MIKARCFIEKREFDYGAVVWEYQIKKGQKIKVDDAMRKKLDLEFSLVSYLDLQNQELEKNLLRYMNKGKKSGDEEDYKIGFNLGSKDRLANTALTGLRQQKLSATNLDDSVTKASNSA